VQAVLFIVLPIFLYVGICKPFGLKAESDLSSFHALRQRFSPHRCPSSRTAAVSSRVFLWRGFGWS